MIKLLRQPSVLYIVHGVIFLILYRLFIGEVYGLLLFAAASVTFSIGTNRLATILERRIRRADIIRFPFARIFYFLVPCVLAFYLFYTFQDLVPRLILAALVMILLFFSVYSFGTAVGHTSLARRRINLFYGLLSVIVFYFLASLLARNTGLLLLLPLSVMLLIGDFMQFTFFRDVGRPYYFRAILITGFIAILFDILLVMNLMTPDAILRFYDIVIKVYVGLLAASVAFAIYVLTQRNRPGFHAAIVMPVQGLALSCLVFLGITALGTLIGTQFDASLFTKRVALETVFSTSLSAITLFRVLIIYFIAISFPFTLTQFYGIIRNTLSN